MPTGLPDLQAHTEKRTSPRARPKRREPQTLQSGRGVLSSSVQPQETNPEPKNVGIFGQPVISPLSQAERLEQQGYIDARIAKLQEAVDRNDARLSRGAFRTPPPVTQLELDFRHSFWYADREKTREALMDCGSTQAVVDRFCSCGSDARVLISADGQDARIKSNKCHHRFCKACGIERQRLITQNMLHFCAGKQLRFLTLTLKHTTEPLADQLDHLYDSFNRLRERVAWKEHVDGAAVFFEVKPADAADEWHPHLHIIFEGRKYPHHLIKSDWQEVTGGSTIVDIRYVYNQEKAIGYVAKYAAKPLHASLYHRPAMLREAITALRGRRACTTTGTWRPNKKKGLKGLQLNEKPEEERQWKDVGSLAEVKARAEAGSLADQRFMKMLRPNGDCAKQQGPAPPPAPLTDPY